MLKLKWIPFQGGTKSPPRSALDIYQLKALLMEISSSLTSNCHRPMEDHPPRHRTWGGSSLAPFICRDFRCPPAPNRSLPFAMLTGCIFSRFWAETSWGKGLLSRPKHGEIFNSLKKWCTPQKSNELIPKMTPLPFFKGSRYLFEKNPHHCGALPTVGFREGQTPKRLVKPAANTLSPGDLQGYKCKKKRHVSTWYLCESKKLSNLECLFQRKTMNSSHNHGSGKWGPGRCV